MCFWILTATGNNKLPLTVYIPLIPGFLQIAAFWNIMQTWTLFCLCHLKDKKKKQFNTSGFLSKNVNWPSKHKSMFLQVFEESAHRESWWHFMHTQVTIVRHVKENITFMSYTVFSQWPVFRCACKHINFMKRNGFFLYLL